VGVGASVGVAINVGLSIAVGVAINAGLSVAVGVTSDIGFSVAVGFGKGSGVAVAPGPHPQTNASRLNAIIALAFLIPILLLPSIGFANPSILDYNFNTFIE